MSDQANTAAPAKGKRRYKRKIRSLIIHKPLQREFLFVVIALLMVSTLAIGFVIHSTIRDAALGGSFQYGKINSFEILSDVSYDLVLRASLILFATLVVLGMFGVTFLHRVAGPVYRFRVVLTKMRQGEIPAKFRLREGDFFTETADEINGVIERLQNEQAKRDTVKQKLEAILQSNPPENVAQVAKEAKSEFES